MPSRPCRWPTCPNYCRPPARYCPGHADKETAANADRHKFYDQHHRDQAAKSFYNSATWERARRTRLADEPVCERCRRAFANTVHHRKPLRRCSRAEALDQRNLMSLCAPCHGAVEAEAAKENP